MVVANNGHRLNAGTDQKIDQHRFDFRLSRFEVIARNEDAMMVGHLQDARHKRILWWAIYVRALRFIYAVFI